LCAAGHAEAKTSITVTLTQILGTTDPAKVKDYTEYLGAVNTYEGLTTVDGKGNTLPLVADSWTISPDNKTYTFHIDPKVTFQDGRKVASKDVVWSIKRLLAINKGPAFLFSNLIQPENVTAPDDATVQIKLDRVFAPFLGTSALLFVVNSELAQANAAGEPWAETYLGNASAGSGPYKLTSFVRGGPFTMERFTAYHKGFPANPIDEMRFVPTTDEATVKAMATRGELAMSSRYQASETFEAIAKLKDYKIISNPTASGYYIKLNHKVAPTDDIHVRRAIAYAIDYATVREQLYPGVAVAGPMAAAFADAYAGDLPLPEYDLKKAADELKLSKYAGHGKIPLLHSYVASTKFEEEVGLLLKSALDPLGFDVTLRPEPWNRLTELAGKAETSPASAQIFAGPTYPSPDSVFYVQYHSKAAGTWASMSWMQDPEVDSMIDTARSETDVAKQNVLYKSLQKKLVADQTDVFLLTATERHAVNRCLSGYEWSPIQSFGYNFSKFSWSCP
jgi:peptide/nickel transport system substrate-binding protein